MKLISKQGQEFELKETEKNVILQSEQDIMWNIRKIVATRNGIGSMRNGKPVRICRHKLIDWNDGTYTIYPNRQGIPIVIDTNEKTVTIY